MSQVSPTRITRAAMKRTLSVGNLDVSIESHPPSIESLFSGNSDKSSRSLIVVNSNSKRRRKQGKSQSQCSQLSESQFAAAAPADTDDVMHDKSDKSDTETAVDRTGDNTYQGVLGKTLSSEQMDEISSLKATVKILQNQLNFVLSYLGIADTDLPFVMSRNQLITTTVSETRTGTRGDDDATAQSNSIGSIDSGGVTNNSQSVQSYANAIRKSTVQTALSVPLKQAVVSAVYADFEEKDRRAKNVVISGLSVSSVSDKISVERLCQSEFGFLPNVVRCRRLGQFRSGHVQPVLTVLQTVDEADYLIRNAKSLRQSSDPVIRGSVYINADLTKAEALAAYNRRCRRRELAASRNTVQPASATVTVNDANDAAPRGIIVLNTRVPATEQPASVATTSQSTSQSTENQPSAADSGYCSANYGGSISATDK